MMWGVEDVTVTVAGRTALDGVSFGVSAGEVAVVVGGDGAGKTTLSRVMARLTGVATGSVTLPPRERVGFQPATSGTWPDLTVRENVEFVAAAYGQRRNGSRIDELLETIGLTGAHDRLAAALSGGMRQKLGVAMALFPEPDLLVLDEPTTGVDPVSRAELWRMISRVAADGSAVAMTTTYVDEAERANRILALDGGRMLSEGSPSQVRSSAAGRVWASAEAIDWPYRWRRGREWRLWSDGRQPPGANPIEPDLTDLLTAAGLVAGERA